MAQNVSKQGKLDSFAARCLFIFCLVCGGWGFQTIPQGLSLEGRALQLQLGGLWEPSKGQLGPDPHLGARGVICEDAFGALRFMGSEVTGR